MRPGLYRCAMRLARFRRLAWVLALVLLAGLAMPALASVPDAGHRGVLAPGVHVHADGIVHVHGKPSAPDRAETSDSGGARPAKTPQHCPGCLTAAECAIACLGVGLLPVSFMLPANPARSGWTIAAVPSPADATPAGDLDPPRPVLVR